MSAAKTPGQVLYEAYAGVGEIDPVDHAALAGVGPDYPQDSIGNRSERAAAAVIAHHEATRPAWPPMRPMSELKAGKPVLFSVMTLFDGAEYWRFEIGELDIDENCLVDQRGWRIDDYVNGFWPLPEVQR